MDYIIINDYLQYNATIFLHNLENNKLKNFEKLFDHLITPQIYTKCLKKIYNKCQYLNPKHMLYAPIRNIKICKKNIEIELICNIFTFGRYKDAVKIYGERNHIYAIIETYEGKFTIEKNNEGVFLKPYSDEIKTEHISIPITSNDICMFSMVCKLIDTYISVEEMYKYDIRTNNCQHFILKFLDSNNLNTQELRKFILQEDNDDFCDHIGFFGDILKYFAS